MKQENASELTLKNAFTGSLDKIVEKSVATFDALLHPQLPHNHTYCELEALYQLDGLGMHQFLEFYRLECFRSRSYII